MFERLRSTLIRLARLPSNGQLSVSLRCEDRPIVHDYKQQTRLSALYTAEPHIWVSAVHFASIVAELFPRGKPRKFTASGVVNVAKACLEAKVPRLVLVSSGGVATPDSSIYKFLNLFGEVRFSGRL